MATKDKSKSKPPQKTQGDIPQVVTAALVGVRELYSVHYNEIRSILDDSETKTVTVNFAVEVDESESAPTVEVRVRFSQAVTDKRITRLDDPNQVAFEFLKSEDFQKQQLGLGVGDGEDGDGGDDDGEDDDKPEKKPKVKKVKVPVPAKDSDPASNEPIV